MGLVSPVSTTVVFEGTSQKDLTEKIGLGTGFVAYGTATSGDASTLFDTGNLLSSAYDESEWVGGFLVITETSDHAAPEGEIAPVSAYSPSLGRITISPDFTAPVEAGDSYQLWKVNPKVVHNLINKALTDELFEPCWTVLSEIPDYDMEQSGVTNWTAGGTATLSKVAAEPRLPSSGKQRLRVVSSTAGDYARSVVLNLEPGRTYHVSAVAQVLTSGRTAKLQLWDETNGLEIQSWTSQRMYPHRIFMNPLVGSGTRQVSVRLVCVESGTTVEWDEVSFYCLNSKDVSLPPWVKTDRQVKGIFQLNPNSLGQNILDAALVGYQDTQWDILPNYPYGLKATARFTWPLSWPLYMFGLRNETPYANSTQDLKYIDPRLLVACTKFKIYEYFSQPLVAGLIDASNFKDNLGTAYKEYMLLKQEQADNLNQILTSDTPWRQFSNPQFDYGI